MRIMFGIVKRAGFTLVEVLIVVVVIGLLAGLLLLTTGASTDKADAVKVISTLRNYKSAALMYYAEQGGWIVGVALERSLDTYLDRPLDKAQYGEVCTVDSSGRSYIGLRGLPGSIIAAPGVQRHLATQAQDASLYMSDGAAYSGGLNIYTSYR